MVLKFCFSLSRGSYIDMKSKGTKRGEVLLLECGFLNRGSNFTRFWKGIWKVEYHGTGHMFKKMIYKLITGSIALIESANVL